MKRIQILKASIVALAIGGAFVTKASTRQGITYVTLSTSPKGEPCSLEAHICGGSEDICTATVGGVLKTYYHLTAGQCTAPLEMNP